MLRKSLIPSKWIVTDVQQVEGDVKRQWISCRKEIFGTEDPIAAAQKYCDVGPEKKLEEDQKVSTTILNMINPDRKLLLNQFDACLAEKNVTKEQFDEALQSCEE